jgi:hypothetical protein
VFSSAINENDVDQTCIFAVCSRSDIKVGPIWGHKAASIKRALATLTEKCECPATRHTRQETLGSPGHPFHF